MAARISTKSNVAAGAPPKSTTRTTRPVMVVLDRLGKRGALRIGWELREGPLGFRELQRRAEISSPTLVAERLREATDLGTVTKSSDGRYALTRQGQDLLDVLLPLDAWAKRWARRRRANGEIDG